MAAGEEKSSAQLLREAQFKEYDTVVAQFRALTEIRFKLLGLLPLGTISAILFIPKDAGGVRPAVGFFGAIVTVALFAYHLRNDQLYDELVSRAAQIERELGLFDGSFLQRPATWQRLGLGIDVEHRWPIALVYAASGALWLSFGLLGLPRVSAVISDFVATSAPDAGAPDVASSDSSNAASSTTPSPTGAGTADAGALDAGPSPSLMDASSPQLVVSSGSVQSMCCCSGAGTFATDASAPCGSSCCVVMAPPSGASSGEPGTEATAVVALFSMVFFGVLVAFVGQSREESRGRYKEAVDEAMLLLTNARLGQGRENLAEEVASVLSRRLEKADKQKTYADRLMFYLDPKNAGAFLGMSDDDQKQVLGAKFATRILAQTIDMPARWIFDVYSKRR